MYLNTYLDVLIESLTLPWLPLFLDGHCCLTQKLLLGLFWTKSDEKPIFTYTVSLINIDQFFQRSFPFQMTFWHELFYRTLVFPRYLENPSFFAYTTWKVKYEGQDILQKLLRLQIFLASKKILSPWLKKQ